MKYMVDIVIVATHSVLVEGTDEADCLHKVKLAIKSVDGTPSLAIDINPFAGDADPFSLESTEWHLQNVARARPLDSKEASLEMLSQYKQEGLDECARQASDS